MAASDRFRRIADKCRAIPSQFGLREYRCSLVRKQWTGERPGDGEEIEELIPLLVGGANPKVRFANQRDVALGNMSLGEITIGPLTPKFPGGGIERRWFDGYQLEISAGQVIRVTAPNADDSSDYKVNYTNMDHALRLTIRATNLMISGK